MPQKVIEILKSFEPDTNDDEIDSDVDVDHEIGYMENDQSVFTSVVANEEDTLVE